MSSSTNSLINQFDVMIRGGPWTHGGFAPIGDVINGNLAQQAASQTVAVTFTAGGTPTLYTTPTNSMTIANSAAPTVVELQNFCCQLRGQLQSIQSILTAQGLTN
jgi:hypothetical protein